MEEESSKQPFVVQLQIDDVPFTMELDTGASLSIMSKNTFCKHWPNRPLESTTRKLRTYTGEPIGVLGTAQVQVTHGKNSAELQLMVVDMDGPSLLGRNWLNKLTLDWSVLHYLHDGALGEVLKNIPECSELNWEPCTVSRQKFMLILILSLCSVVLVQFPIP